MDGVELAARFSLATNRLRYCGPEGADRAFYRTITDGTERDVSRTALGRFEALVPYLEAIGRSAGRDPFDERVVEAYWIGNDLLDGIDRRMFLGILDGLVRRGLPRSLARRLAEGLPEDPIAHHAFHVAYVGVGNVTGHVPTTLANMEACRPKWATVRAVGDGTLRLAAPTLGLANGALGLGPPTEGPVPYDPRLLPGLAVGASVAVHWGLPILRLSDAQLDALRRATARALAAANATGRFGTLTVPGPAGTGPVGRE